jgi:hypothetical protein
MNIEHSTTDMKQTMWIMWICLMLFGVCLPLGFIVTLVILLVKGTSITLGPIFCIIGLSYMLYDCGKSAYRQLPWKTKL